MAITTMAGIQSGLVPTQQTLKTVSVTTTTPATGNIKGGTDWYSAGSPTPATANAAGINGQALSAPVVGASFHGNPASGNSYLAGLRFRNAAGGMASLWLIDRLWENSGLDVTSTATQSITPAALPARDINGSTNGEGVMAAIEWSSAAGAGTPTVTISYTNSAGTAGQTASFVGIPGFIGVMEFFPLAAGDTGIRSVQSVTQTATRTTGVMHLVLFRMIAMSELDFLQNGGTQMDGFSLGLPRLYDGTVHQRVLMTGAGTSQQFAGAIQETNG